MGTEVRRGTRRFVTRGDGVVTHHSFSFGAHYDPANLGLGPLVCHDDHLLEPGSGFPEHRHSDLEIVTWVVSGALRHDGSSLLRPGEVAVQSAGSGVVHSEVAADAGTRFVQAWLRPDVVGGAPQRGVAAVDLVPGRLTPVVGGGAPLRIGVAGASLAVVRLEGGQPATLPGAPLQHVYVVTGSVGWDGEELSEGDALHATDGVDVRVTGVGAALLMAWRFSGR